MSDDQQSEKTETPETPESQGREEQTSPFSDEFNKHSTKTHEVLNEVCGFSWIEDYRYDQLIKYGIKPDKTKKNKLGFEMESTDGRINWSVGQDGRQLISHPVKMFKTFTQDDAAAMVALTKVFGWTQVQVHGTVAQKEMLWLAVQLQNLLDQEFYDKNPKRDESGKKIEFVPTAVVGFTPIATSKVWQQLQQAQDEYKARNPKPEDAEPGISSDPPPAPSMSENAAPEKKPPLTAKAADRLVPPQKPR